VLRLFVLFRCIHTVGIFPLPPADMDMPVCLVLHRVIRCNKFIVAFPIYIKLASPHWSGSAVG